MVNEDYVELRNKIERMQATIDTKIGEIDKIMRDVNVKKRELLASRRELTRLHGLCNDVIIGKQRTLNDYTK